MTIAEEIHQQFLKQVNNLSGISEEARQHAAQLLTDSTVSKAKEEAKRSGIDEEQLLYLVLVILSMPSPPESDPVIH